MGQLRPLASSTGLTSHEVAEGMQARALHIMMEGLVREGHRGFQALDAAKSTPPTLMLLYAVFIFLVYRYAAIIAHEASHAMAAVMLGYRPSVSFASTHVDGITGTWAAHLGRHAGWLFSAGVAAFAGPAALICVGVFA